MRILILFILLIPPTLDARLLLFDSSNEFKGCLDCSRYDSDSICNKYGTYGSKYNSYSIWNKYGTVGNKYNGESPFSKYGKGLKIVDDNGTVYGYFKIGSGGATKYSRILKNLVSELDDRSEIRDAFCQ